MLELNSFLSIFLGLVITLAVPPLAYAGYQFAKQKVAEVKSHMSAQDLATLQGLTAIAVQAAEQSGLSGQIEKAAGVLKQYAIDQLQMMAESRGIKIDVAEASAHIEAAVLQGIHKKPEIPANAPEAKLEVKAEIPMTPPAAPTTPEKDTPNAFPYNSWKDDPEKA